ncbi:MAG TPA: hypothetical protein VGJ67_08950 [Actinomycetota bacterium]
MPGSWGRQSSTFDELGHLGHQVLGSRALDPGAGREHHVVFVTSLEAR